MRVETRSETVDALDQRIEEALQALSNSRRRPTWGIALREIDRERFVVLPPGALTGWTVDTRPAVKLPRE